MKMIMLVFNEAMDEEVTEVLQHCRLEGYTRLNGILGKGTASGTHLGTDVWPGRNNAMLIAAPDEFVEEFLKCVRKLRQTMGAEGIKAFTWQLESVT